MPTALLCQRLSTVLLRVMTLFSVSSWGQVVAAVLSLMAESFQAPTILQANGVTPLPWPIESEYDGHECWCGLTGCLETFISGTAVAADYASRTGVEKKVEDIAASTSTDLVAESVCRCLRTGLPGRLHKSSAFLTPARLSLVAGCPILTGYMKLCRANGTALSSPTWHVRPC